MGSQAPILIAYDGSRAAQTAVTRAADLFPRRSAIVLTAFDSRVGETMLVPDPTGLGTAAMPYDPTLAAEIDREVEQSAHTIVSAGAELARRQGLDAQELLVQDASDPAEAILGVASERDAAAIVLGSRGHGGIRAKLLGSVSDAVLKGAGERPVLIVHAPRQAED